MSKRFKDHVVILGVKIPFANIYAKVPPYRTYITGLSAMMVADLNSNDIAMLHRDSSLPVLAGCNYQYFQYVTLPKGKEIIL